jgi:2-C-methyl-D-erythritol 4-phosphate cytidylyltransferase
MKFHVIIPASGSGLRYGSRIPKQFSRLLEKEIIVHTIEKFSSIKNIETITVTTQKRYFNRLDKIFKKNKLNTVARIVKGGATRHDSVYNGLKSIDHDDNCFIIIHDAVRPFITVRKVKELMNVATGFDAVIPGLKVSDTIKEVNKRNIIKKTVPRNYLWEVQTPQVFRYNVLWKSFEKANLKKYKGTDESSIVEQAGYKVKIIEGENTNIKITTKDDLRHLDFKKLLNI